ncbi:MAG TPA: type II toxin-antitoxin system PemK/MazF family toxin [Terracidiphilus sp.]
MKPYSPDCGDLVWFDFDPQAGREQAGRRPALVLSARFFNLRTSLAYVCPITSKIKGYPFEVLLPPGLPVRGAILCEHMRSMDWRVRNAMLIGRAPDDVLLEVREIVGSIAGIAP